MNSGSGLVVGAAPTTRPLANRDLVTFDQHLQSIMHERAEPYERQSSDSRVTFGEYSDAIWKPQPVTFNLDVRQGQWNGYAVNSRCRHAR